MIGLYICNFVIQSVGVFVYVGGRGGNRSIFANYKKANRTRG
jgi:hypothetical protein